jgi:hypothetical protein
MASSGASRGSVSGLPRWCRFGGAAVTMMVASDQNYKQSWKAELATFPALSRIARPALLPRSPRNRAVCVTVALAPSPAAVATKISAVGLGVTALLAVAAFGFFRILGWVAADLVND